MVCHATEIHPPIEHSFYATTPPPCCWAPEFHPLPEPKLPEKHGSQPPTTTYSAPEQGA